MEKVHKMPRSLSFVDIDKTRRLRDLVLDSIQIGRDVTGVEVCYLGAMTGHSLMLPPVSMFPQDFQEDLNKQLIDRFMQKTLEEAKVLNWCRVSRPLTPVQTTGDGNCLLHAVSQYMWGIHDRDLTLRRLLNRTMVADMTEDMKRRWNRSCKSQNQHVDLEYTSLEWKHEWNIVVSMTDPTPNPPEANDLPYKSLEEFHIFVLANLLRRPIIILAEDVLHNFEGHTFAPIHFSGIYLPLRWKPEECVRSPIILGYLQQHFTPLLSQEEAPAPIGLATGEYAVPLVKHDLTMLTVQFLLEDEENQARELLQKYLDLMELPYTRKESISMVLAAKLNQNPPPEKQDLIKDFFHAMEKTYKKPEEVQEGGEADKVAQNELEPPAVNKEKAEAGKEAKRCDTRGCDMYGTAEQNGLCTTCFRESRVSKTKKPPRPAEAAVLPANVGHNSSMLMRECRTPGCQYFCSIAAGEYCHECHEKINGDQRRREVEVGRATQSVKEVQPPAGNPNKCITEGCNNDRNPDNENLCDVCFVNIVTKSGQPPSVHPLKQTERASSLGIIPTTPQPLHSIENRTNSQSLGQISDFTHPAKCIIPECQWTGYPKTNDMCKRCYFDQQGTAAGAVAAGAVAAGPVAAAIPTVTTPVTAVAAAITTMAAVLTHISATFTSAKTSTPGGSPTCKTVGCEMFGAPGQNGYCSQCYLMELGKKYRPKPTVEIAAIQKTVATAPQRPAEEVYTTAPINDVTKARYFKKCKTTDCFRVGLESSNGLCPECHSKETSTRRITDKVAAVANLPSSGPEELVSTGAEGSSNNQVSTQSETRPLGFELSSSSALPLGPIDPQTGESNNSDFTNPAKCIIPECQRTGYPQTNDMCKKCYIDQHGRAAGSVAAGSVAAGSVAAAVTTVFAVLTLISSTLTSANISTPGGSPTNTAGCEMFGAPGQDRYCSRCYLMELIRKSEPKPAEIAATQHTVATAPQWPAEEVYTTAPINDVTKKRYFKKCKTTDCMRIGLETSNGLCPEFYTKESGKGRFAVKTTAAANLPSPGSEELVPTGTDAEGGSNNQISTQSETRPPGFELSSFSTPLHRPIDPQTGANNSTKCLNEGCPNLKLDNTGGRCYWCLKKGKIPASPKLSSPQPAAAPSSTVEPPPAAPTNTTAAASAGDLHPVPSLVDQKQCPAPHCDAYGDAMYNNLCSECYHTLKEYFSKKSAASANPLPNGRHHSPEELSANTIITAGHGASVVVTPRNVTMKTEEGGTVSVARTTRQHPVSDEPQLPCVNAAQGCEMFGTKEQMGFCFRCFCKHTSQQAGQSPIGHPSQPPQARTSGKGGAVTSARTLGPDGPKLPSGSATAEKPPAAVQPPITAYDNDDPPPAYDDVVSSPPLLEQQPTEVASAGTSTVINVHRDLQVLQEKQQEYGVITANHSPINSHEEQKEKSLPIPVTNNSIHTGRAADNKEGDWIILHEKVEEVNAAICVDDAQQVDKQMEALSSMSAEAFTPTAGNAPHFGRDPCPSPNPAEEMPINMEQESTKLLRPREPENQAPPPKRCVYAYASISSDDLYRSSASNTNVTSEALCSNSPVTADVPSSKPKELVALGEEESSTPHSLEAPSSNSEPLASSTAASAASMGDAQLIPLIGDQKQCPVPHCDAYGDAMYNNLCSKCYHTLKEYFIKKPAASVSPLPNGPHHSSEELPANTIITAGHGASVVMTPGNVTVTTEEGGTTSVARTTGQLPGQPPVNHPPQPPVNHPPQPPVNQPPQPANQHQGETPLRVLAGASCSPTRLPQQRCIAPGCEMRGSPENLNLCSECYLRHLAVIHRAKDIEAHKAKNCTKYLSEPCYRPGQLCRGPGCQNEATDELGFCPVCFNDSLASGGLGSFFEQSTDSKGATGQSEAYSRPNSLMNRGARSQLPTSMRTLLGVTSFPSPGSSHHGNNYYGPVFIFNGNLPSDTKSLQGVFSSLPIGKDSPQKCKKPGCTNYGNEKCYGYCNACYDGKVAKGQ